MNKILTLIITGVGGQGILTLSEIIGRALIRKGFNVKSTEIHGLAQRGGSVVSHLKAGFTEFSPIADEGSADVIIGLELLETLRAAKYMNSETIVLINDNIIKPVLPKINVPDKEEVFTRIKKITKNIIKVDADGIARKLNAIQVVNTVMLGALAGVEVLPLSPDELLYAIKERIAPKFHSVNELAFNEGYKISRQIVSEIGLQLKRRNL
ncbi:MAG: indolepyruvate oxidoreductase subunit beta [Thermoprotei archaeon]|jgi:indolepyruvate ferredoxin oxidoreductase beta subunit